MGAGGEQLTLVVCVLITVVLPRRRSLSVRSLVPQLLLLRKMVQISLFSLSLVMIDSEARTSLTDPQN